MTKLMMCLYDVKMEQYFSPFCVPTLGVAYRQMADEIQRKGDSSNMLAAHPQDFVLMQVATFDEETGVVSGMTPKMLCNVKDLKAE